MYLHLTTGTLDYLTSLHEKYDNTSISSRGTDAILYYEDDNEDSVFTTKMTYEVIENSGELDADGPMTMYYIPSAGTGFSSLRAHVTDLANELSQLNGVLAYRFGVNEEKETYMILVKWADLSIHDDFKYTDVHEQYLTTEALKKFRTEESLFGDYLSSKTYYTINENVFSEEEKEELGD